MIRQEDQKLSFGPIQLASNSAQSMTGHNYHFLLYLMVPTLAQKSSPTLHSLQKDLEVRLTQASSV